MLRKQLKKDITELKRNEKYSAFQIGLLIALWPFFLIPTIVGIKHQRDKTRLTNKIFDNYEKILTDKYNLMNELKSLFDDDTAYSKFIYSRLDLEAQKQHQDNIDRYQNQYKELENKQNEKLLKSSEKIKEEIKMLENQLKSLKTERKELKEEIKALKCEAITYSFNFDDFENIKSEEIKNKLVLSKNKESALATNGKLITVVRRINYDKKHLNNNIKQIARLFNSECENITNKLTIKNMETSRNKLVKSFNSLNKIFEVDGLQLSEQWLEIKLEQLNMLYSYEKRKDEEKELQKAIKEQMMEEEKVRREIEQRKKKLEKDQTQCNNEITKLIKYLQKTQNDAEKELYLDKIKELEKKIKELESEKEIVLERETNAQAGYVYVISNIGSFGENIYKIGMTRRLEPMDRIKELSSASVPFEFDVHAMIFSDNAPELENILHQTFKEKSVNQVNFRKEFFKVSLDEIEDVVKAKYNNTVEFTKIPVASEYRQTLEILKNTTFEISPSNETPIYA